MSNAERFVRQKTRRIERAPNRRSWRRLRLTLRQRVLRLFRREPGLPEDPYAYVGAPKKPRLPHLRSSASAPLPE